MDFKVDDDVKAPSAHQLAPSRKAGRQDWELQPTDGFSTPAEPCGAKPFSTTRRATVGTGKIRMLLCNR